VVEYDGTAYSGWQRQPAQDTVQGAIEDALKAILRERVPVNGSGRTDSGVHALGQVASCRVVTRIPSEKLVAALNGYLPRDITVLDVQEAPEGFHARRDALSKLYRYRVLCRPTRPALERYRCHHESRPLDLGAMRTAGELLVGAHDFRAFACKVPAGKSCVRTVKCVDIRKEGDYILFDVEADGFLQHMVRTIVGTLLEVGLGRRDPDSVRELLRSGLRSKAGPTAPARGLYLVRVDYSPYPRDGSGDRHQG
jgi:tRNA pseudouridine38-40 synthase